MSCWTQTGPLSGPPESYLSRLLAHKFKPNKITILVIPTYLTCRVQKLCCVCTRQHPLPVWSHKFVLSSPTHISTNSHPFLVGIVSD